MIPTIFFLAVVLGGSLYFFAAFPLHLALTGAAIFAGLLGATEFGWALLTRKRVNLWKLQLTRHKKDLWRFTVVCVALVAMKALWAPFFFLSGEKLLHSQEKQALLERREWIIRNVADDRFSLSQMPQMLPVEFQKEWAIGSLSMATGALTHLAFEYPETRDESLLAIERMIRRMLQRDIESFEDAWWHEGALSTLSGDNGHAGYLGHLNFMLGAYRMLGGDGRFNELHRDITAALSRRILAAPHHYIETFPGEIFIPDVAVAVCSIAIAHRIDPSISRAPVDAWLDYTKQRVVDRKSGILKPWITPDGQAFGPPRGSYAAWTTYYLGWIDPELSRQQYKALKEAFAVDLPFGAAGLREYARGYRGAPDIDSGPVIFGLSTSGTGFMVAGARLNGDAAYLDGLLRTAEIVGSTLRWKGTQRYLLAPVVGDAIMLAMMSAREWDTRYVMMG